MNPLDFQIEKKIKTKTRKKDDWNSFLLHLCRWHNGSASFRCCCHLRGTNREKHYEKMYLFAHRWTSNGAHIVLLQHKSINSVEQKRRKKIILWLSAFGFFVLSVTWQNFSRFLSFFHSTQFQIIDVSFCMHSDKHSKLLFHVVEIRFYEIFVTILKGKGTSILIFSINSIPGKFVSNMWLNMFSENEYYVDDTCVYCGRIAS